MKLDMENCGQANNVFFLAVNTGFAFEGVPDQRAIDFYAARSKHGLKCAIVGNVVIPGGIATNNVSSVISSHPMWKELAISISTSGAEPGIQLSSTWSGYQGMRKFVSPEISQSLISYKQRGESFSREFVDNSFDRLMSGTRLAVEAGFRHIQLHAAHGYLFNLLIDPRFSSHADYFQGLVNQWAIKLRGINVETSIRFSLYSGDKSFDEQGSVEFIPKICNLSVDYLDISAGLYNLNKRLIYPTTAEILSIRQSKSLDLAISYPRAKFIISGKASNLFKENIPHNAHIGLCRDLIANADFLENMNFGCNNCNKCHYFSRNSQFLTCGRW